MLVPHSVTIHVAEGPLFRHSTAAPGVSLNDALVAAGVEVKPESVLLVYLNGELLATQEWDAIVLKPGDSVVVKDAPRVETIAGILIAWGVAETLAGVLAVVLVAAISYGVSYLLNALFAPSQNDFEVDPEQLDFITGARNRIEQNSPVPCVFGRHVIYPPLASAFTTAMEGDEQYLNMLLMVGFGKYAIEQEQLGNTALTSLSTQQSPSDVPDVTYAALPPGAALPFYVASEQSQKPLSLEFKPEYKDTDWSEEVTLDAGTVLSFDIVFPQGLRRVSDAGNDRDFSVFLDTEYRAWDNALGTYEAGSVWTKFAPTSTFGNVRVATLSDGVLEINGHTTLTLRCTIEHAGLPDKFYAVRWRRLGTRVGPGEYTKDQNGTGKNVVVLLADAVIIALRIGVVTTPVSTKIRSACTMYALRARASGRLNGTIQDLNLKAVRKLRDINIDGTVTVDEIETRNPALAFLEVLTGGLAPEEHRVPLNQIDTLKLYELKEWCEPIHLSTTATGGSTTTIVKAGSAWSVNYYQDNFVTVAGERRRVTSNTADTLTVSPAFTNPVVNGTPFVLRRYRFAYDRYLTEDTNQDEFVKEILAVCRGRRVMNDLGQHSVVWEEPKSIITQVFTEANSSEFQGVRVLTRPNHALKVGWVNPNKQFQLDQLFVYQDGYNADGSAGLTRAVAINAFNPKGVTDQEQAYRLARFVLKLDQQQSTYTLKADWEHLAAREGELVHVQASVVRAGSAAAWVTARIIDSGGQLVGLSLDRPVKMAAGSSYGIRCRVRAGDTTAALALQNPVLTGTQEFTDLLFATPQTANATMPDTEDLVAFGIFAQETIPCLVLAIEPLDNLQAKLILRRYDAAVFSIDTEPFTPIDTGMSDFPPDVVPPPPEHEDELIEITKTDADTFSVRINFHAAGAGANAIYRIQWRPKPDGALDAEGNPRGNHPWRSLPEEYLRPDGTAHVTIDVPEHVTEIEVIAWTRGSRGHLSNPSNFDVQMRSVDAPTNLKVRQEITPTGSVNLLVTWDGLYRKWYVDWRRFADGVPFTRSPLLDRERFLLENVVPGEYTFKVFAARGSPTSTIIYRFSPQSEAQQLAPSGFELVAQGGDTRARTGREHQLAWRASTFATTPPELGDDPQVFGGLALAGGTYELEVIDRTTGEIVRTLRDIPGSQTRLTVTPAMVPNSPNSGQYRFYRIDEFGERSLPATLDFDRDDMTGSVATGDMSPETVTSGVYLNVDDFLATWGAGLQLVGAINVTFVERSALLPVWVGIDYVSESGSNNLRIIINLTPPVGPTVTLDSYGFFLGAKNGGTLISVAEIAVEGTYRIDVFAEKLDGGSVRANYNIFTAAWKR
jgi:hypothetical protein